MSSPTETPLLENLPIWRRLWALVASSHDPERVGSILTHTLDILHLSLNAREVLLIAPPFSCQAEYRVYVVGDLKDFPRPRELFARLWNALSMSGAAPNRPTWTRLPQSVRSVFQADEALLVPIVATGVSPALLVIVGDEHRITNSQAMVQVEFSAHIIAHVFSDAQIAHELHTLLAATRDMAESQDLDTMLHRLLHYAIALTYTEAASILLQDERTSKLVFKAAIGPQTVPLQEIEVPMNSIAGRTLREHRPVIVNDVSRAREHFRKVDEITGFRTRSLMAVPIQWQGHTIGVLEVVNRREGTFDEHDLSMLQALAAQAGALIRHAQLSDERQRALEELRQLDERKTQFMHLASHELRTPLTIIRGYAELVEGIVQAAAAAGTLVSPEELLPLVAEIIAGTQRMGIVLDEITHAAAFTREFDRREVRPIQVRTLVGDVLQEIQDWAHSKGLHVRLQCPRQSITILGDYQALREAIFQVISNAYKFTPKGGRVEVVVDEDGENVYVRVKDSGPGIPEAEHERIFAPFYQVENPLTRQHPGLGLGLTIAKRVVEEHGGRIWVDSAPGKGATFVIMLPKEQVEQ